MLLIDLIKQTRKRKGITQTELAKVINLSKNGYANIEQHNINLKAEDALTLCAFLGIDITSLYVSETRVFLSDSEIEVLLNIAQKAKVAKETKDDLNPINAKIWNNNHLTAKGGIIAHNINAPVSIKNGSLKDEDD